MTDIKEAFLRAINETRRDIEIRASKKGKKQARQGNTLARIEKRAQQAANAVHFFDDEAMRIQSLLFDLHNSDDSPTRRQTDGLAVLKALRLEDRSARIANAMLDIIENGFLLELKPHLIDAYKRARGSEMRAMLDVRHCQRELENWKARYKVANTEVEE